MSKPASLGPAALALLLFVASCTNSSGDESSARTQQATSLSSTTSTTLGRPLQTAPRPGLRPPDVTQTTTLVDRELLSIQESLPILPGQVITVLGAETGPNEASLRRALEQFEELTGATVNYTGSREDVSILNTALKDDTSLPDVIIVPQPGRLEDLARSGVLKPLGSEVRQRVSTNFDPFWSELVSIEGELYGVPAKASVKSLVWYSPAMFEQFNYEIPTTWAELEALTEQMRFEGQVPWCVGIASGSATGWVVTDWMEDLILRFHGPEVYDQWVAHQIPANDPRILEVTHLIGDIFHEPGVVLGGPDEIVRQSFSEAGLPVLDGDCLLHRQASFYGGEYVQAGAELGRDVDVFYLPTVSDEFGTVVLGAGNFATATNLKRSTMALLDWIASAEYANARVEAADGGFLSANRNHDTSLYSTSVDQQMATVLVDADPFRFDGSDLMPAAVGSGELWQAGTGFASGTISAEAFLDRVEAAWSIAATSE